ncbi:Olfactory receptor 7E24 [Sciurus carolinensis]|uniref:Olfactory receptor 7E24 n=1 Tax=Sciurus carolinensis TaxID=30640 RepID=A0AA41NK68_SCICA|nr:Olfactory receptor 7E24 [Sciurus carolinensis]
MIVDIQTHSGVISYGESLPQMSLFLIFGSMDGMLLTVMAYDQYVAICHPPSSGGKHKAFSTCGSHLSVVCLFYGTGVGVYLASAVSQSPSKVAVTSMMYTVVIPMLNPFLYSLKNEDIKSALRRLHSRIVKSQNLWHPFEM